MNNPADLFAQQMALRGSQGGKNDDAVNSEDTLQALVKSSGKATYTMARIIDLPINLSGLGETSITQPLDSEGIAGKTLPGIIGHMSSQGGFLAKLLHDIFIKNRDITDHTAGINSDGSGSTGGGGGDFAGGGGGDNFTSGGISHFDGGHGGEMVNVTVSALPTGADRFEWSEASMPANGFVPASTPNMGVSAGAGMDIG